MAKFLHLEYKKQYFCSVEPGVHNKLTCTFTRMRTGVVLRVQRFLQELRLSLTRVMARVKVLFMYLKVSNV